MTGLSTRERIEAAGKYELLISVCRAYRVAPDAVLGSSRWERAVVARKAWMRALRQLQCSDVEIGEMTGCDRRTVAKMLKVVYVFDNVNDSVNDRGEIQL